MSTLQKVGRLPVIPGYRVWWGRCWLHAQYRGTFAQSRQQGRPWHVVAPNPAALLERTQAGGVM